MRSKTFYSVASRFAQTIGRSQGISLIFKGDRAMTDGKKILLPALPPGLTLTEAESKVFMGYLDHEVGHVKHSDFRLLNDWQRKSRPSKVCSHLLNIFEDVREEACYIEEYPGARQYLDATHTHTHRKDMMQVVAQGGFKTWGEAALAAVYCRAFRNEIRGFDNFIDTHTLADMELEPVGELIDAELPKAQGIADIITLAEKVEEMIREKAQEQPQVPSEDGASDPFADPQDEPGDDQQGDSGKSSDSQDTEDTNSDDDTSEKSDGQSDEKSEDEESGGNGGGDSDEDSDDDSEGSNSGSGSQDAQDDDQKGSDGAESQENDEEPSEGTTEAQDDPSETDPQEELDKAAEARDEATDNAASLDNFLKGLKHDKDAELEKAADKGGHETQDMFHGNQILPPGENVNDKIFEEGYRDDAAFDYLRSHCSAEITALKKMLNTFLRSREHKAWSRGLEEGQLDTNALWGLRHGNKRVYKQRRSRTMVNTAVSVMIDCSASMNETLTRQAAIILCESLAAIPKVKVQISGFTTDGWGNGGRHSTGRGRIEDLRIPVYKKFDEPYSKAKGKLGGIQFPGCTPLGEGYCYGFESLITRDEPRRILWIITDGEPYYSIGDNSHSDWLLIRRGQLLCLKNDIETIGFGIGHSTNRISQYTDRYGHASGFAEMQKAILDMLRNTLAQSVI